MRRSSPVLLAARETHNMVRGLSLEKQFDELILRCVDDALSILGEDGRRVVLWLCETKINLSKKQIPLRIKDFSRLVEDTFGAGASIIEGHIVQEIERTFNLPNGNGSDLSRAIQLAKEKFSSDR